MITDELALNLTYKKTTGNRPSFISDSAPYGGLRLHAYKTGNKTWIYRYRHKLNGKLKQVKIGSFDCVEFDLSKARLVYSKYKADRDLGKCPATTLKNEKDRFQGLKYTIELMVEDYYCEHVDIKRNKRSSSDFYMLCKNTIYPLIGHIPVKHLDVELMTELSKHIETPSRLNSVRVTLGAAFEWAIRKERVHHSKRTHTYKIKTKFLTRGQYA
jgi:hypothetical protein